MTKPKVVHKLEKEVKNDEEIYSLYCMGNKSKYPAQTQAEFKIGNSEEWDKVTCQNCLRKYDKIKRKAKKKEKKEK